MKIFIAIMSCCANQERRNSIKNTWLKSLETDMSLLCESISASFFVGNCSAEDAISLNCPDDYNSCALKQFEMIKYCVEQNYDYVFFCDDDTYVDVFMLVTGSDQGNGERHYDYSGYPCIFDDVEYAHGGAGFWLSRKAMEIIVNCDNLPDTIYSDRLVGFILKDKCKLLHDFRYNPGKYLGDKGFCNLTPNKDNEYITTHFVDPKLMRYIYGQNYGSLPTLKNEYEMNFFGFNVLIIEKHGSWHYRVLEKNSEGFRLANEAEQAAFNYLSSIL